MKYPLYLFASSAMYESASNKVNFISILSYNFPKSNKN